MLTVLNISNFALIDELQVEFELGLNLLTGETGSGKSIIVDALGILIGGRFSSDLLKSGASKAFVEGLFSVERNPELESLLESCGIALEERDRNELLIRREISASGKNKIFINHQLATQSLLRDLRAYLVDIHGQGEQQTLFDPDTHLELLDAYAAVSELRQEVAMHYKQWASLKRELEELHKDEADKLQLSDLLRFQIDELERAELVAGEDEQLEEERRRLTNVEKITTLCTECIALIYEDHDSAISRLRQAMRRIDELGEYDTNFRSYGEGLESARALLDDLAYSLRDFTNRLEFSPERLGDIEDRLAELSRLKRKYGGAIETALEHLARSKERLANIEHSDERERELRAALEKAQQRYRRVANDLHNQRVTAAQSFDQAVVSALTEVALENSRFETKVQMPAPAGAEATDGFSARGMDRIEFFFSANPGEGLRPLAKVASGGEASRLMLVLKTVANASEFPRTIVFDEIDTGIGGRVAEAVGIKLKTLSATNQVLCVTHQPQMARFADCHLLVRKEVISGQTEIQLDKLDRKGRIEELARMLTGAEITETARRHAREMLKG